ncbi:MAG: hypothetical protein A2836_02295 [Candidatus Taylorbacteria bacterium RIFCSPHIGHO2_01_FULL_45_63]|uniref:Uncharacterized protein n=1 Tax=Candidatus Taylorbacteria bacterium RIFCSPHIGHO2_02_FULL_45_35 TaxID=1802311 RepID=A0A1G2MNG0_9BACT|nr:MAG: hypothetical protein A2836_02295 [Candidatus Taylorbacteria bacterium RIFCSPHIGHO2_01_FULL_45_63]OHA25408.1 MAG: hypothetical protein A3D56_01335 [Candidatus Taylorbacteria bacterium RIFCSPHIGHO2_02_FULL_45_35]OHA33593.1 MAG: hypothetical protein A3A22_03190 [Candidatus Taylorbacteria bacterium RIFCSPLOWO2_01_FULL_45_34b]
MVVSNLRKIEIRKGTSRIILISSLFPNLVVKVPIVRLRVGVKTIFTERKRLHNKETWDEEVWWGIGWCLYKGILDNWREYRFYKNTKHQFLQPTFFSLLGLINFQKRGELIQCDYVKFWRCIHNATDRGAMSDSHHFSETRNFCLNSGVKILDYGSPRTQLIIKKFGVKIMEDLDLNFPELNRVT